MNAHNLVLWAIVGIAIIAILVSLFLYQIPGNIKTKFDNVCDKYYTLLVSKGSLTAAEINSLNTELSNMNLKNITVSVTEGGWGEEVQLVVNANIEFMQVFGMAESIPTKYDNASISLGKR